jgi:glycerol-3-phosphate dehydrogenase subunit B
MDSANLRDQWFRREFLDPRGHPIFQTGVKANPQFGTWYENLYAIGGILPGDFIREGSLEGVAIATGYQVGEVLA